jgi:hypothetical protein
MRLLLLRVSNPMPLLNTTVPVAFYEAIALDHIVGAATDENVEAVAGSGIAGSGRGEPRCLLRSRQPSGYFNA